MIGVVVAVDVEFETAVTASLGAAPGIEVVRRPADEIELLALASAGIGDVVLVGRWFPGIDAEVVARLHTSGVRLLGFGDDRSGFRTWGVEEVVSPWAGDTALAEAVHRVASVAPPGAAPDSGPSSSVETRDGSTTAGGAHAGEGADAAPGTVDRAPAPVIAVWGTGSAPGRSVLAGALAHVLSREAGHTVLVDADTVAASQASLLGLLDESPRIASLCRAAAAGTLGPGALVNSALRIDPDLDVVTGLGRAERWPEVRPAVLGEVLDGMADWARFVVVDVADRIDPDDPLADPHYDRHGATRAVLDRADRVLLVAEATPLGLQRLVRLLETERVRDLGDRVTVVMNRVRASAVGSEPERRIRATLARFVHVPHLVCVPDDRALVDEAVLLGRTVVEHAPRSAVAGAIRDLALGLPEVPVEAGSDGAPRRGRRGRRESGRVRSRLRAAVRGG